MRGADKCEEPDEGLGRHWSLGFVKQEGEAPAHAWNLVGGSAFGTAKSRGRMIRFANWKDHAGSCVRDAGNKKGGDRRLVAYVAVWLGARHGLACRERVQRLGLGIIGPGGTRGLSPACSLSPKSVSGSLSMERSKL